MSSSFLKFDAFIVSSWYLHCSIVFTKHASRGLFDGIHVVFDRIWSLLMESMALWMGCRALLMEHRALLMGCSVLLIDYMSLLIGDTADLIEYRALLIENGAHLMCC